MPTLQLLQDVQTRLERGGRKREEEGGGADREERGRIEGGREKYVSYNIETSMYGCVSTSSIKGGSSSSKNISYS